MNTAVFSTIELMTSFFLILIFYQASLTSYDIPKQKRLFLCMIICNISSLCSDVLLRLPAVSAHPLIQTVLELTLIVPFYLIEYLFLEYVLAAVSIREERSQLISFFGAACSVIGAMAVFIALTAFPESTPPSPFYTYLQIPGWLVVLTTLYLILSYRRQLGTRRFVYSLLYILIPIVAMMIRYTEDSGTFQHLAISVSIILLYTFVHQTQSNRLKEQAIQLEQTKNMIVLSQIKPHFIYNSLNTIYYLCEKDPSLAQKAIIEFSDYLRGNLDTIGSGKPVPFEHELNHIRHYLYLEKLRFDDYLNIVYDIQASEFYVPPLSVQLAVENAVKHGICHKPGGGTVWISSAEGDQQDYVITVKDDGAGFDMEEFRNNSLSIRHVGLRNMIFRVKTQVNGTVNIKSAPDQGTTVEIRIPRT